MNLNWNRFEKKPFVFLEYLVKSMEKSQEAFEVYDTKPKDNQLIFQELEGVSSKCLRELSIFSQSIHIQISVLSQPFYFVFQIPNLAVTENMFNTIWDLNQDGYLTLAELTTVIYTLELA